MKRLTGWDALLLYSETPNVHMHTLTIAVVELVDLDGRTFGIEIRRAAGLSGQLTVVAKAMAQQAVDSSALHTRIGVRFDRRACARPVQEPLHGHGGVVTPR